MKITIIGGAGTLGSCAAFTIINRKLADELLLIDPWADMLKGHWLDLSTAASGADIVVKKGGYEDMAGSDIVIVAASAPSGAIDSRSELLPINIPIIKDNSEKINRYCPDAIVITETNPVDPLNYAMYLMSKSQDRQKFIGYSLNDTLRFRMWAAEALGVQASRVKGTVIGEHGHSQVMLFSSLRLDGKPVTLSEDVKNKIREQPDAMLKVFESLKPSRTAGWTSAVGAAMIIDAIKKDSGEEIPCNTVLMGEYGLRNLSMTVPVIIGREGVRAVKTLDLAADEREGLKKTVNTLSPYMRYVEEYIEKTIGRIEAAVS